jgi:hypothetical protein
VTLQHQDHTRALLPSQPCPQEAAKGGSLAGTSRDRACMSGWNHLYTTFQLRVPFLRADSRYMTVYYESCASTHRDHDGQVSVREGATGNDQARKHDSTHVSYRMNLSCSLFNPSAASDHPTLKRQYGQYRYSADRLTLQLVPFLDELLSRGIIPRRTNFPFVKKLVQQLSVSFLGRY